MYLFTQFVLIFISYIIIICILYHYGIYPALLALIIWCIISIIFYIWMFRKKKQPTSSDESPYTEAYYHVYVTPISSHQDHLAIHRNCGYTILQIKLEGEEIPETCSVYTHVPEGYNKTFDIVMPTKKREFTSEMKTIFSWKSQNATSLEVSCDNFDNVIISIKSNNGVNFKGKISYNIISNGEISSYKHFQITPGDEGFN
jgi:hypothetical protein